MKSYEGYKASQVFGGRKSGRRKVYGLRSESQAHQALEDYIREVGIPYWIYSDNAKAETSRVWTEFMRRYGIKTTTSEPHNPCQDS